MSDYIDAYCHKHVALKMICGPMFAGKTTRLIQDHLSLVRVPHAVFSPAFDDRYSSGIVRSHDGNEIKGVLPLDGDATLLRHLVEISAAYAEYRGQMPHITRHPSLGCLTILVDEIQFFDIKYNGTFIETLMTWCKTFNKETGIPVLIKVFGLDMNTDREVWPMVQKILLMTQDIERIKARCSICGSSAPYTVRMDGMKAAYQVGGSTLYEPRCEQHLTRRY